MEEKQLTKEQIAEYEKAQAQRFIDDYNQLVDETGYVLVPVVQISDDGRIVAGQEVRKK